MGDEISTYIYIKLIVAQEALKEGGDKEIEKNYILN